MINLRYNEPSYTDRYQLFIDYLRHITSGTSTDKLALFQELFFLKVKNDDFLSFRDQKDEITGIIAQGAAGFPIKEFLSPIIENIPKNGILNYLIRKEFNLAIFKKYCEIITLENYEDALIIAKLFFLKFRNSGDYNSAYKLLSAVNVSFFNEIIFMRFIDNDDFVSQFLGMPGELFKIYGRDGESWFLYYLSIWILYQKKSREIPNSFKEVWHVIMHSNKITFPEKIADTIMSDKLVEKQWTDENTKIALYLIRFNYTHENFISEEFIDYLFELNKTITPFKKLLRIIYDACQNNILEKTTVLKKLPEYIRKYKELFSQDYNVYEFSYLLKSNTEEAEYLKARTDFFTFLCEEAFQETEPSWQELRFFLMFYNKFEKEADIIFTNKPELLDSLIKKCSKMLNAFRTIYQKEMPDEESGYDADKKNDLFTSLYLARLSADFIYKKTGNIWKALKPLLLTLRAAKKPLLKEALNYYYYRDGEKKDCIRMIIDFFNIEDKEQLNQLRIDMANDFAEYLKPANKTRQIENYTEYEQNEPGFDLNYTEPSPFWRYAYLRALADLGVKIDDRGHYFEKILENVSESDPSEEIRKTAKKVKEKLNAIRNGSAGGNQKKRLFEAFWWLKYAHMLSLGAEVNEKGALETRIQEWRYKEEI
jgi:hypothetical protein